MEQVFVFGAFGILLKGMKIRTFGEIMLRLSTPGFVRFGQSNSLNAGVACVGIGSKLITDSVITKGDYAFIENKEKETLAIVNEVKK